MRDKVWDNFTWMVSAILMAVLNHTGVLHGRSAAETWTIVAGVHCLEMLRIAFVEWRLARRGGA